MSRLLLTHPGKIGDALWALATVKALAADEKSKTVDMMVSTYLRPLLPLLKAQPYIEHALVAEDWNIEFSAPVRPIRPPGVYCDGVAWNEKDWIINLGMEGWPHPTLLEDPARRAGVTVNCWEPWLSPLGQSGFAGEKRIGIAFTSEWCELKAGLIAALLKAFPTEKFYLLTHPGERLTKEWTYPYDNLIQIYTGVSGLSDWMMDCRVIVCCKSMARVMALGLGVPTVVCEPSVPRQQAVFDPPTTNLREIISPSFDARDLCQSLEIMLQRLKSGELSQTVTTRSQT